jgi:hypothetical protein
MPKRATQDPNKPKKTRARHKSAYVAKIVGDQDPTIIIAFTQAEAVKAVVTLREATHHDLMDAGKHSWPQIDATVKDGEFEALRGTASDPSEAPK